MVLSSRLFNTLTKLSIYLALLSFNLPQAYASTITESDAKYIIQQTQKQLLLKPEDMQLSFTLGMAYQALKKHKISIKIFKGMLNVDPKAIRPRLELAKSLFLDKQYDEALYHFEQVLSQGLPASVALAVSYYISEIKAHKPSYDFNLYFVSNNNPNKATSDNTIVINGLTYSLSDDAKSKEVRGVKGTFGVRVPIPDNTDWFISLNGEHTEYDEKDMNFSAAQVTLGRVFPFSGGLFKLQAGPLITQYGGSKLYDGYVAAVSLDRSLSNKLTGSLGANVKTLDYVREYKGYDALDKNLEFGVSYAADLTTRLGAHLVLSQYSAEYDINSYSTKGVILSINKEFKGGWRINTKLNFYKRDDEERNIFFGVLRSDETKEISMTVSNRHLGLWGIVPKVIITKSEGMSNIDLYEYSQESVMLGFSRSF